MQADTRPDRLAAIFDYAEDRAAYLDVREAVTAALDAFDRDTLHVVPLEPELARERGDFVVTAARAAMGRVLIRRLETQPRIREALAAVVMGGFIL